jgi:septal ring factor EnvC (AmiA/AmiB activator)
MMFARRGLVVLVAVGALLALVVGCGPKPPCPVAPSDVKGAQANTAEVELSVTQVQAERANLEKELAEKTAKLESMKGKPAELEKKLDNLKKGSGR